MAVRAFRSIVRVTDPYPRSDCCYTYAVCPAHIPRHCGYLAVSHGETRSLFNGWLNKVPVVVDAIFIIIIAVSVVVAAFRGLWRESMSLLTWVVAIAVTILYSRQFSTLLPTDTIESLPARLAVSALALFIGCLFIGALINFLFVKLNEASSMSIFNRFGGIIFGFLRGAVINTLLVLAGHLFPGMQQELWWRESRFLPVFDEAAASLYQRLPPELASYFDFTQPFTG